MRRLSHLIFILILLPGCRSGPAVVMMARPGLGTVVEITVADRDKPRSLINNKINQAFAEIKRIDKLLSRFNPESDISLINTKAYQQPTRVSRETIALLENSLVFSQLTNGCFDITVYPLLQTWGFAGGAKKFAPSREQITQALDRTGYQYINIDKGQSTVSFARQGMSLDLSAIAKGYAVDRAVFVLKQAGLENILVNAGGDIYASGRRQQKKKWTVGLQHPRKANSVLTYLELENMAVATSGDYQRFLKVQDKQYSHIINPKTGRPCADIPASVTVLAQDCLTADALATAIFVLGAKQGLELVNQLEHTEAIVIEYKQQQLNILLSQGLDNNLNTNQRNKFNAVELSLDDRIRYE